MPDKRSRYRIKGTLAPGVGLQAKCAECRPADIMRQASGSRYHVPSIIHPAASAMYLV
ncbi:MAG TPA: hypothetical protein PK767_05615 [Clostridiales bacterium]|nr:hypothetical protein [Clostridiales bacterium]